MPSIAVVGNSGEGKSSSYGQIPELGIKGLDPKETFVINVGGKDLPFRGQKTLYKGTNPEDGNYFAASEADKIAKAIGYISESRKEIKNIVIDDAQFIMSFEYMRRAKENGYNKFIDIGLSTKQLIDSAKSVRKDLNVYFLWHTEDNKEFGFKMKTVGNMIDQYLTLEALFTIILYSKVEKNNAGAMQYYFVTNNDGKFPAKSPVGMFTELYIKNDLNLVKKYIKEYYG